MKRNDQYKSAVVGAFIGWIGILLTCLLMVIGQALFAQSVYVTKYQYQADKKIYVVDYPYQADKNIFKC